jgi:formate dehydrogenase subunit gamma
MCLLALHIYLGTIGMRGAYTAMRHGVVDEAWAEEHHAYWYEEVKAGKVPAQRSKPVNLAGGDTGETVRPA